MRFKVGKMFDSPLKISAQAVMRVSWDADRTAQITSIVHTSLLEDAKSHIWYVPNPCRHIYTLSQYHSDSILDKAKSIDRKPNARSLLNANIYAIRLSSPMPGWPSPFIFANTVSNTLGYKLMLGYSRNFCDTEWLWQARITILHGLSFPWCDLLIVRLCIQWARIRNSYFWYPIYSIPSKTNLWTWWCCIYSAVPSSRIG